MSTDKSADKTIKLTKDLKNASMDNKMCSPTNEFL